VGFPAQPQSDGVDGRRQKLGMEAYTDMSDVFRMFSDMNNARDVI